MVELRHAPPYDLSRLGRTKASNPPPALLGRPLPKPFLVFKEEERKKHPPLALLFLLFYIAHFPSLSSLSPSLFLFLSFSWLLRIHGDKKDRCHCCIHRPSPIYPIELAPFLSSDILLRVLCYRITLCDTDCDTDCTSRYCDSRIIQTYISTRFPRFSFLDRNLHGDKLPEPELHNRGPCQDSKMDRLPLKQEPASPSPNPDDDDAISDYSSSVGSLRKPLQQFTPFTIDDGLPRRQRRRRWWESMVVRSRRHHSTTGMGQYKDEVGEESTEGLLSPVSPQSIRISRRTRSWYNYCIFGGISGLTIM